MSTRNTDTVWNTFVMHVKAGCDKGGNKTLESILQNGEMPLPEEFIGHEYNGYSTWGITKLLGMAKFTKGFITLNPDLFVEKSSLGGAYRSNQLGQSKKVGVYNIQTQMNELNESWIAKRGKDGQRMHFGYGDVYPAKEDSEDKLYKNSLLINYGLNPSNSKHPVRNFRDYIVCAVGDDPSVLIGKSYTVLGPKMPIKSLHLGKIDSYIENGRLRTIPNYFVLIKAGKSEQKMERFFAYYEQTTRTVKE